MQKVPLHCIILHIILLTLDSTYLFNEPLELHHHGPNAPRAPGGVMAIPKDPKNDLWSIG